MKAHLSMPHSDELERSLLGACVYFPDDRAIAVEQLTGDDFYAARNAELFAVIRAHHKANTPCDPLLMRDSCRDKPNALALLDEMDVGLHPDIDAICQQLRSLTAARRLTRAAMSVGAAGIESSADPDGFLDRGSREITAALDARDSKVRNVPLGALCHEVLEQISKNEVGKAASGFQTGVRELDRVTGGLEDGRLYVVAGRPGMGKSALGIQMIESVAGQGGRCVVFSLEMPGEEIARRMMCSIARVDSRALSSRKLNDIEARRFANAGKSLSELPIVFPEAMRLTVEQIARVARQEKLKHGLDAIMVDYIQLIRSGRKHDNREQEVSEISRELKLLARELEVPVIAISQLNRDLEKRADKRPLMSDLRESGAIEQDADAILLLYREDYYSQTAAKGLCEIIVGKNRGGETGFVRAHFDAQHTRFMNLEAAR